MSWYSATASRGWQRSGLKLDYLPTVSRSDDARNRNWTGPIGRAEAQLSAYADSQRFDPRNVVAYVCGSPPMVDACTARLRGAGMPDEAVRVERF